MNSDAPARAQALRDSACTLLREAARSSDAARRDALTRKALAQIEQAERLRHAARATPPHLATRH